ncbi:MAG: protoporphyrinogen oxidase [Actinomycetota bacterium]
MRDVVVVGGGLSGLLVGAELKRRGLNPRVLEGRNRSGGVASTVREDHFLLEPAAGSILLPHPDLSPIFDAAGVPFIPARDEARMRFVFDRETLFEVPESPKFLLTGLASWPAKFRAAREPWVRTPAPDGEESLLDFFTRRFGVGVGTLGANLMAHGVFAGDPSSLSIQAAFPKLPGFEAAAGSVIKGGLRSRKARPKGTPRPSVHVPRDGMADVADKLAGYIGDRYLTNSPVHAVTRDGDRWKVEWAGGAESADAVVVALAPADAAQIVPDPLTDLLAGRIVAQVVVVGLGGPAGSFGLPSGFGALTGPESGIRALGILFESQYAPGRAPEGHHLAKGIYGGAADPEITQRSDDEIAEVMREELSRIVGKNVEPSWTRVLRSSIPQYPIGHASWMDRVDDLLADLPGLHLAGWGYRGIGISSLGADASRIASTLAPGTAR